MTSRGDLDDTGELQRIPGTIPEIAIKHTSLSQAPVTGASSHLTER
jgi:hypothetical protein